MQLIPIQFVGRETQVNDVFAIENRTPVKNASHSISLG
jgi:hypothetical protein